MLDFLITGGHVIDPANNVNGLQDVAMKGGKIVSAKDAPAKNVVDAAGYYVLPGLIDGHAHSFYSGSGLGVPPDFQAATGITTVIDAGTAGWANYSAFHNTTVVNSRVKVKALIGYNSSGQVELGYMENYDRKTIRVDKICKILDAYPGEVLGLKMRFQEEVVGPEGLHFLKEMIDVANAVGCPIVVHTTNSPVPTSEIADLLRPGDVFCHCFQGKGNTILDKNGHVYEAIWNARKRGVYFDAANGTGNFAFSVAIPAIENGFFPDIISADNASNSYGLDYYAKNLPFVMSKYLTLGMSLPEIVRCVTEIPAKWMGMEGKAGTLQEGACADLVIMKLAEKKQVYWDSVKTQSTAIEGNQILVPQLTILDGEVVFRSNDF